MPSFSRGGQLWMAEGPRMEGNSWFMSLVLWSNKVQINQKDDKKNKIITYAGYV